MGGILKNLENNIPIITFMSSKMFTEKKININSYNVSRFVEKFGDASIQNFCNVMLEKIIDDKLIELTDDNLKEVKQCAAQINKDPAFVINSIIERFDLIPVVKPDKIKVEVTAVKQIIKTNKKNVANQVSNW